MAERLKEGLLIFCREIRSFLDDVTDPSSNPGTEQGEVDSGPIEGWLERRQLVGRPGWKASSSGLSLCCNFDNHPERTLLWCSFLARQFL